MSHFLTAEWRHLLMLNYCVEPAVLRPYVPAGVELDEWNGLTFASMVGFRFLKTRVRGWPVPGHRNFDEVNLRFYVRRRTADGWKRGVVFIKELVPRPAIALIARYFYNEPYYATAMRHRIELDLSKPEGGLVQYSWRHRGEWQSMQATITGQPKPIATGSEEEFITEHYWGYTKQKNGGCKEYQVEHPRWEVSPATQPILQCDIASIYGDQFKPVLTAPPQSVFLAVGSAVKVSSGLQL